MNTFQLTLLIIFAFALVIGVLIFAGVLPGFRAPTGGAGGTVVWWGTISTEKLTPLLEQIRHDHETEFTLNYVEKDPATIEADLLEALALGKGPDLVTLASDELTRQAAKLTPISYQTLPAETFRSTFVAGTHARDWSLFLVPAGVLGLPLYVDPLVLYYNQDLLTNAKVSTVPSTWKELAQVNPLLAPSDGRGNLTSAGIALGAFSNIAHAKEILALLIMQAGNPLVGRDKAGLPQSLLKDNFGLNQQPTGEAVSFFLRFTNPANTLYSWNSSQSEARAAFVRGKLALYLGWGSELARLAAENPQLNFYLALPPQRDTSGSQVTIGRFHFLALARGAKNPATALTVASLLAGAPYASLIATAASLPPARSDLLGKFPNDPDQAILYQAAIIARDWLDPAPEKTATIFRRLVETVALGQVDLDRAVTDADVQLTQLLPKSDAP